MQALRWHPLCSLTCVVFGRLSMMSFACVWASCSVVGFENGFSAPDTLLASAGDAAPGATPADPLRTPYFTNAAFGRFTSRFPAVGDATLKRIMDSPDTMFYDDSVIVPAYQDSLFHPIDGLSPAIYGARPLTVASSFINTAVAGGYQLIFEGPGAFHFPFGHTAGTENETAVVNFWHSPRANGQILPVAYWIRDSLPRMLRWEWTFPIGTVFGEIMFFTGSDGQYYPYEIRTRTRASTEWAVASYRPFPTAESFAQALEARRNQLPFNVDALIAHARNPSTLRATTLSTNRFSGSFPTMNGAMDELPSVSDPSALQAMLLDTGFVSVGTSVWKQSGNMIAYAPTTNGAHSIVPSGYKGGFFSVDNDTCKGCHGRCRTLHRPLVSDDLGLRGHVG